MDRISDNSHWKKQDEFIYFIKPEELSVSCPNHWKVSDSGRRRFCRKRDVVSGGCRSVQLTGFYVIEEEQSPVSKFRI